MNAQRIKLLFKVFVHINFFFLFSCGGTSEEEQSTTPSPTIEITSQTDYNVSENISKNSFIADIVVSLQHVNSTGVLTYSFNSIKYFIINSSGRITTNEFLDYETTSQHIVVLTISYGELETTQQLTFNVVNLNDNPPSISSADTISVMENSTIGSTVLTITANGNDGSVDSTLSYAINPSSYFSVNSQGEIVIAQAIDYEETTQHTLVLTVNDGAFGTTQQLTFNVINLNDNPPSISSADTISVTENSTIGSTVLTITADGNDGSVDSTLSYAINPSSYFSVNSQREIIIAQAIDYEETTQHTLVLTVNDGAFETTQQLTFNIANLNDNPPSISSADTISITENSTIGSTVLTITADGNDGSADSALTYAINPSSYFSVNSQGEIVISQAIDYEETTQHTLVLSINDGVFDTTQPLTFNVINLNDNPPSISSADTISVTENSPLGTLLLTITADGNDGSADSPLNYAINPSSYFSVNSQGEIVIAQAIDYEETTQHTLVLTVNDGAFETTQQLTFNVVNLNDNPPSISSADTISVTENSPLGTLLLTITADGNDGSADSPLNYAINPSSYFSVNSQGEIIIAQAIDYEEATQHTLVLTVNDGAFETTQPLTFNVINLNDNPPSISSTDTISVMENSTIRSTVLTITANSNDGSADSTLSYAINPSSYFSVNSQGEIVIAQAIDYEETTQHTLVLSVNDDAFETTQQLTFNVVNLNDNPPSISSADTISVTENSTISSTVLTVTADGNDGSADSALTYAINPSSYFSVNSQGEIVIAQAIDYEETTQHTLVLSVNDDAFETTQQLTFNVVNLNDNPPSISSADTISITENSPLGTLLLTITADGNDGSADSPLSYAINPSSYFSVNSQGEIVIEQAIDYEETTQHTLVLTVNDGAFETTQQLTFNVVNLNDNPPSISSADTISVTENSTISSTVLTITADGNDGSADSALTYAINPSSYFSVNSQGEIVIAQAIDYEETTQHTLVLSVNDGAFETTQQLTFNVVNLNDNPPSISSADTISVTENSPLGTLLLTITADGNDGSADSALTYAINPSSYFSVNSQGEIVIAQAIDYEETTQHTLVLTVNDGTFETTQPLTFNVINLNDNLPSISSTDTISVTENSTIGSTVLTITANSNDGSVDSTLSYAINPSSYFSVNSQGEIVIAQAIDYEETTQHTLVLSVNDDAFETTQQLTFNVVNLNDNPPSISGADTISVMENSTIGSTVLTITADGNDGSADSTLSYAINPSSYFSVNSQGEIVIAQAIDYEETTQHTLVLSVNDDAFETTQPLTFNVVNLNDNPPSISSADTISVTENSPLGTLLLTITADGNDGSADSPLSYAINPSSYFSVNSQGEIVIAQAIDYEETTQHTLVLTVNDGAFDTTQPLTFNVVNLNDNPPSISGADTISVTENSTIGSTVLTITADGNDGSADSVLSYAINPSSYFSVNSQGEIVIAQAIDYEETTQHTLVLSVNDGVFETTQPITFNVVNLNDNPPSISSADTISVMENATIGSTVLTITADGNDGSADSTLIYAINPSSYFSVNSQGEIVIAQAIDYENTTQHTLVLTVNDSVFDTTQQLTFNVVNLNDNPPSISSTNTLSVTENSPLGTLLLTITADGNDGSADSPLSYAINPSSYFSVNSQGEIVIAQAIDYEETTQHTLVLTVNDGVFETTQQLTFNVVNLYDSAPLISSTDTISVTENSSLGTLLLTIIIDDNARPADSPLTYAINPSSYFSVNSQGEIVIAQAIDYEETTQHTLVLSVNDGVFETTQQLTFNVVNLNDNPPSISSSSDTISVTENATIGSTVLTITADGNDGSADSLSYAINPSSYFSVNSQGEIVIAQAIDYEETTQHTLVLSVNDGVFETTQQLTFNVVNLYDSAPLISNTDTISVTENSSLGTLLLTIIIDDNARPADSTLTYAINPSSYFSVNSQGEIVIAQAIDYEETTQHTLVLTVNDGVFNTTQQLTFNVVNLNDNPPSISSADTISVTENSTIGSTVLTITADGNDGSADSLSYAINPSSYFSVNSQGEIVIAQAIDYEETTQHTLVLSVNDGVFETTQQLTFNFDLKSLSYRIKQGVIFTGQLELASWLSNAYTPVFLAPLPADSTFNITNPDIQEFSILYEGNQSSFTVAYSFRNTTANILIKNTGLITFIVDQYDPLRQHQWHLKNTGQSAFATLAGNANEDIRVASVHQQNILGEGIQVSIVDTGLIIDHEDLRDNVVIGGSYDFVDEDNDPTPSDNNSDHGTSVAGLVAMRGWNALGGVGVAPMASLRGYNFLQKQNFKTTLASLGYDDFLEVDIGSEQTNIFNLSYGYTPTGDSIYPNSQLNSDLFRCGTTGNPHRFSTTTGAFSSCDALNAGKGAVYIKAAGNAFNDSDFCPNNSNISCEFANGLESTAGTPYVMIVGAVNNEGVRSSYSSAGPALWVSAPGGEFGYSDDAFETINNRFFSNFVFIEPVGKKSAMVTTDVPSCNTGYTQDRVSVDVNNVGYAVPLTPFHGILEFISNTDTFIQPHPENQHCNYISTFNGTSAAAPVIAGVAALVLSANQDLYWRDVRYILAKTARKVDVDSAPYLIRLSDGRQVLRTGWSTNTAGFSFHHWYGFGVVNAEMAVNMAKTYSDYLTNENFIQGDWIEGVIDSSASTITDNSIQGVIATVTVSSQQMQWIEGVQIRLSVTHPYVSDLTAKLISPSGTESIILRAFNSLGDDADLTDTLMYSNAFYRETIIDGEWKLVITDNVPGNLGEATAWQIRFFGQKAL